MDAGGDYVLLTYEQINDRIIYIGDHVRVSADTMDDLIKEYSWSRRDSAGAQENEVRIPASVAKYDNPRVVAYQPSLDPLLEEWLDHGRRAEMAAGRDHDYLLVSQTGKRLRPEAINEIVKNAADRAGLNRKLYADASAAENEDGEKEKNRWKITAHNIRHGYGSYLVNKTDAGLWEVSKQMGHSSVDVTEDIYVDDDPRAGIEHSHEYGPD